MQASLFGLLDLCFSKPSQFSKLGTNLLDYCIIFHTSDRIRDIKSLLWYWYVGRVILDYCTNTQRNKCSVDICPDVWKYFLEGCHRLRSINPVGIYAYTTNPNRWCAGQNALNIYEISRRFQLKVVFKKHFVIHIQMVLDLS